MALVLGSVLHVASVLNSLGCTPHVEAGRGQAVWCRLRGPTIRPRDNTEGKIRGLCGAVPAHRPSLTDLC